MSSFSWPSWATSFKFERSGERGSGTLKPISMGFQIQYKRGSATVSQDVAVPQSVFDAWRASGLGGSSSITVNIGSTACVVTAGESAGVTSVTSSEYTIYASEPPRSQALAGEEIIFIAVLIFAAYLYTIHETGGASVTVEFVGGSLSLNTGDGGDRDSDDGGDDGGDDDGGDGGGDDSDG